MSEGRLIRKLLRFERNFVQLPNDWVRDRQLSLQARGLLAMLMSYDHGFKVSLKAIADDGHGGVDRIRSCVNELETHGYLIRRPRTTRGRFTGDDWELADPSGMSDPALIGYAGLTKPRVGKSNASATALENPMRTALENPTPIRTLKNTPTGVNPGDPSTRAGDEEEPPAAAVPTADEWADLIDRAHGGNGRMLPPAASPCPKRKSLPCSITSEGVCLDCGMTPVELVAYLAKLAEAPSDEQPAEVVVS